MKNRSACITGASRGIGAAIARQFAEAGARRLFLVARPSDAFDATMAGLTAAARPGQTLTRIDADLSQTADVFRTAETVSAAGGTDVLVNNAGFTAPNSIFEASFAELEKTMGVNLFAPFILIQDLLRRGNRFSHIVNIASSAGIAGRAGWSTYSASKAALIAFSESLREELSPLGTRVVCVSPGRCATDLRKALAPEEDPTTIMQPESVAAAIAFLVSDAGRYMDSDNIVIRK